LRANLRRLVPALGARVDAIQSFDAVKVLAVTTGRVTHWHRPGLLLIGDAAHIMSPVGGVGINYAIQDAVAAANLLTEPLRNGSLTDAHLAAVQARREWPTRMIQGVQALVQRRVIAQALRSDRPFRIPLPLRIVRKIPVLRRLPALVIGRGFRVERLQHRRPWPSG
jgi:2-polyprenyl-6-methoxyphenol hydroxylase-like FAD-dependent oxidoreductase